jgi:Spy/CpxP family protein refolding chaperone
MKRFQLAIKDIQSTGVVETNRLYFLMRSVISFRLPHAKKIIPAIILLYSVSVNAQQNDIASIDTAYQKVIAERTGKIINTLGITDPVQYKKAQQVLAGQYFKLNAVHDAGKANITAIKAKQLSKDEINEAVKQEDERRSTVLKQQHTRFIAQLKEVLTEEQIEKVKDGMTYRVLPVTWAAYMDMLQKLTQEQKDKMYAWLLEARELAMDEGSSDKKHAVFGKYKGKINNYLSAAGYDMKKEGEEWAKRIQKAKDEKNTNN